MSLQIGPIPVPDPGEKQSGYFTFSSDPQLAKYRWPYFSIAGARPGPTFLITAGIHCAEYPGIVGAIQLGQRIQPAEVSGTVLVVPLLNVPGFYERSVYVNPEDNENINRVFPGHQDGSWSERFAYHFLSEIALKCDFAVDLHGGDMVEDLVPFAIYRSAGDPEVDRKADQMLRAYGADWVVKGSPTGERSGQFAAMAVSHGVATILVEAGRCGLLEEDAVRLHVDGVLNILRTLGILSGTPVKMPPPKLLDRFEWLRSEREGIFFNLVGVGDSVANGQKVGHMTDLLGNHLGDIVSPVEGTVLFLVTSPAMKRNGLLMGIGVSG